MNVVLEEIRKEFLITLAYPAEIAFWIVGPVIWVVPLIFQGQALVGSLSSSSFGALTGTKEFIPYVLVGAIVSTYMLSAVWSMGNALRNEMYYGTLEHILSSPVRPMQILIGKGLYNTVRSTFFVIIQMLFCVFLFGLDITLHQILPIVFFIILLLIGLYGVGFMAAALTLLIKESHGVLHMFEYVLFLFSPIRYPVEVHPITRTVSLLIPLTYALVALRGLLLGIEFNFWKNALLLMVVDAIIIPVGLIIFSLVERRTKQRGTLAEY